MSKEEQERQASVLMQAGISSSLIGEKENALTLITAAKKRFEELDNSVEVAIASGWITGLSYYQQSKADTAAAD